MKKLRIGFFKTTKNKVFYFQKMKHPEIGSTHIHITLYFFTIQISYL